MAIQFSVMIKEKLNLSLQYTKAYRGIEALRMQECNTTPGESGYLRSRASLPTRRNPLEHEAEWAAEGLWTIWRKQTSLSLVKNRNKFPRYSSP